MKADTPTYFDPPPVSSQHSSVQRDRMTFLFNSSGKHIANLVRGQLHAPSGRNIGHFLERQGIIIDMRGRYLGEITRRDRLMYNNNSPHKNTNYGVYGNHGNVGNFGNPGRRGSIGTLSGYRDIETPWLD